MQPSFEMGMGDLGMKRWLWLAGWGRAGTAGTGGDGACLGPVWQHCRAHSHNLILIRPERCPLLAVGKGSCEHAAAEGHVEIRLFAGQLGFGCVCFVTGGHTDSGSRFALYTLPLCLLRCQHEINSFWS